MEPKSWTEARSQNRGRIWLIRAGLLVGGAVVGLALCELFLVVAGIPKYYKPHTFPAQFAFLRAQDGGRPVYVSVPSQTIRFVYDGNPRGYFGPENEIDQTTNSLGFRGPEFELSRTGDTFHSEKPPRTLRLLFLGDSFTFGEGVRFEDIYPEVTARLLREHLSPHAPDIRSYDFGVGGYNTAAELYVLKHRGGFALGPDIVVVGYVLNDAEGPLFVANPFGMPIRQGPGVESLAPPAEPPDDLLGQLRTVQLVRRFRADRQAARGIIDYYRGLYSDASPGWQESRRALQSIIKECVDRGIPCVVLIFPMLLQLDEQYPFVEAHEKVRDAADKAGASVIDLLPRLKGMPPEELWVHPVDQHPNEKVHQIAAEALVESLLQQNLLQPALKTMP